MSFEGYYQCLCKKGHRVSLDCWSEPDEEVCYHCKEPIVWQNLVDQTNGEEVGFIPDNSFKTLLVKDVVTETCICCGNMKILEPATYRIPTEDELLNLRTIFVGGEMMTFGEWNNAYKEEDV